MCFKRGNNDNEIVRENIYYGIIKEILELNYYHKGNVVLFMSLRQNTKAETCTNEERRRAELASPMLHHALQRNQRRAFARVAHFTI
jgi:hypothetical protein